MKNKRYTTVEVDIKLREAPLGNNQGRTEIESALLYLTDDGINIVDIKEPMTSYWRNDEATLVIEVKKESANMGFAIMLADFVATQKPDEFHTKQNGDTVVMRFWWD